jgi:hypothetical protein
MVLTDLLTIWVFFYGAIYYFSQLFLFIGFSACYTFRIFNRYTIIRTFYSTLDTYPAIKVFVSLYDGSIYMIDILETTLRQINKVDKICNAIEEDKLYRIYKKIFNRENIPKLQLFINILDTYKNENTNISNHTEIKQSINNAESILERIKRNKEEEEKKKYENKDINTVLQELLDMNKKNM